MLTLTLKWIHSKSLCCQLQKQCEVTLNDDIRLWITRKGRHVRVMTINCLVAGPDENLGLVNTWDFYGCMQFEREIGGTRLYIDDHQVIRREGCGRGRLSGYGLLQIDALAL